LYAFDKKFFFALQKREKKPLTELVPFHEILRLEKREMNTRKDFI